MPTTKNQNVIEICNRLNLGERAQMWIINASNLDHGIQDENLYVGRSTLRDRNDKLGNHKVEQHTAKNLNPKFIQFDGRIDPTLTTGGFLFKENHTTVISQPAGTYLTHFSPKRKGSKALCEELLKVLQTYEGTESLIGIGSDGTAENVGYKMGAIRQLELELKRPLTWGICMLHYNELYFRRLFIYHDIGFSSGGSFRGPIGQKFQGFGGLDLEEEPIKFKEIPTKLKKVSKALYKLLNKDTQYLYDIVMIIHEGKITKKNFLKRIPGKVVQSRFVTLANNLCRLYIQTSHPSEHLIRLVTIVVQIYAPLYFDIRMNPKITDAARHFFRSIELARTCLNEEEFELFKAAGNDNSYSCHPELIFIAALTDPNLERRKIVFNYIMKDRKRNSPIAFVPKGKGLYKIVMNHANIVRQFFPPGLLKVIDYEGATDYFNMLPFDSLDPSYLTESSLTKQFTEDEFIEWTRGGDLFIDNFPCHR